MDDQDKIVRRPINNEKVYKNPKAYEKGDLNAFHYYFAVKKEDLGLTGKVLMTAKIIGTPITLLKYVQIMGKKAGIYLEILLLDIPLE